ncbi:MAG TPA: glycosyltransferase family 4 protein [Candidatus Krumholzibacteria bacterium]|nr:glycosyltransferase family 4 protein [Candidatus Krumholzibacteria bacterium]
MNVMVLTPYLPHARVGHGGGTAVRDLVRALARSHRVRVVALMRPGEQARLDDVRALGAELNVIPYLDGTARGPELAALVAARGAAWVRSRRSGYPAYVQKYRTGDLARRVVAAARDFRPDAIQVEYLQMALLARDLRRWRDRESPATRLVLNSHELGSVPRERRAAAAGTAGERRREEAEAARWRRLQVDATAWADTTLCVTPGDHALYAAMGGRNLRIMPLGMDTATVAPVWTPAPGAPPRFLFVASWGHRPNVLAAGLLLDRVWPRVRAARPDAQLVLAGRGSDGFLAARPADGVTALGFVDDLAPLYREATLVAAPLAEGGGIKIKILEAMARGVPVVTTTVGAEGITDGDDAAAVIAPPDERFADAMLATATDAPLLTALSQRGRALIERKFSWTGIAAALGRIYAGEA